MQAKELRDMTSEQLGEELDKIQDRLLREVRMRVASGEGVNPHEARDCRRDIARIKTILREREIRAASSGAVEKGGE